jgi:hypothetical protein
MRFRTLLLLAMPLCGIAAYAAAQSRGHHLVCVTNQGGFVLQANFEIGSPRATNTTRRHGCGWW